MKDAVIKEIVTSMGTPKWLVLYKGQPVGNYWTKEGAERAVKSLVIFFRATQNLKERGSL